MDSNAVNAIKHRLHRRIAIKSLVFALWAAGMAYIAFQGSGELPDRTYLYMVFSVVAVWAVTTIRDIRRLRNKEAMRKAAIERSDERNILITYKATRLSVVILLCALPVAVCLLAYNGMQEAVDAIGIAVAVYGILYIGSWFYVSKKH